MGVLRSDRVSGLGGANAINGSVHFQGGDGSNDTAWIKYIDAGVSEDYNFGTGDFTVECWINRKVVNNDDTIWGSTLAEASSGFTWYFNGSGNLRAYVGGAEKTSTSNSISAGTWYHVAITRASGTMQMWVDGVSKYSATVSGTVGSSTQNFIIGNSYIAYSGTHYHFLGHISNLRIQKGKAEYTAAFTPPTTKLGVTPETVLLACHNPGNVLAEATGKTLTLVKSGTVGSNSAGIVASRFVPDVGEDHGTTFADGAVFDTLSYMVPPGGTTTQRGRDRGVASQGYSPGDGASGAMTFFNISSGGITQRFGSLVTTSYTHTGGSSSTRGVIAGGYLAAASPVYDVNTIEYVTIATTGNALNFGDRTVIGRTPTAVSSETRVCMAGGGSTYTNIIDFITTSTTGDATNFGDLGNARTGFSNSMQSTTRGIFAGGYQAPSPNPAVNTLEYITMASAGDATNFGDMTSAGTNSYGGSMSSNTRGVTALGNAPGATNIINYVTIATTGDAVDFGDMTTTRKYSASCSSHTRGVIIGGETPTYVNTIEYITIATTGNSIDFGDFGSGLSAASRNAAFSDCHGGLS
jgi:hypothetical protein